MVGLQCTARKKREKWEAGGERKEKDAGGLLIFIPRLRRPLTDGRDGDVTGASQARGFAERRVGEFPTYVTFLLLGARVQSNLAQSRLWAKLD